MGLLKDLLIPGLITGARVIGQFLRLRPGPRVTKVGAPHGPYTMSGTRAAWELGLDRCEKCLRYDPQHARYTDPPCPGRWPDTREHP